MLCGRLLGMAPHEIHVLEWHARPLVAPAPAAATGADASAADTPTEAVPSAPAAPAALPTADATAAAAAAAAPDAYPGLATAVVEYVVRVTAPNLPRSDFKFTRTQPPPAAARPTSSFYSHAAAPGPTTHFAWVPSSRAAGLSPIGPPSPPSGPPTRPGSSLYPRPVSRSAGVSPD